MEQCAGDRRNICQGRTREYGEACEITSVGKSVQCEKGQFGLIDINEKN